MIKIIKRPCFENDDYLIKCNNFKIDNYDKYISLDPYTKLKSEQFASFDISKEVWLESPFIMDHPALRSINNVDNMSGSIYTVTCSLRNIDRINCYNDIDYRTQYENCIDMVKRVLAAKPKSRRVFMRMANSLSEYTMSEIGLSNIDNTCLAGIHFLNKEFKLIFRASDIKNELISDILTIYKYFIVPVYGLEPLTMTIYSSTAQNFKSLDYVVEYIEGMINGSTF